MRPPEFDLHGSFSRLLMTLTDVDLLKPKGTDTTPRPPHPAARWLPVIATLLLGLAIAANVAAHETTSWLKTTTYPTLFNSDGLVTTGVNGDVTARVSVSEICYTITNPTPPIRACKYCIVLNKSKDKYPAACDLVQSKDALADAKMAWNSTEAEFIRLVCGGVGDATLVLHLGAISVAGVAVLAVVCSCCLHGRVGRTLRIIGVVASLVSGVLALTTYIIWIVKIGTSDMHHGKSAVLTAGSVFLFAGAALTASGGLEIFNQSPATEPEKANPELNSPSEVAV